MTLLWESIYSKCHLLKQTTQLPGIIHFLVKESDRDRERREVVALEEWSNLFYVDLLAHLLRARASMRRAGVRWGPVSQEPHKYLVKIKDSSKLWDGEKDKNDTMKYTIPQIKVKKQSLRTPCRLS